DRAREADRGGVRAGTIGAGGAPPSLAGPPAPAADPRRGAPLRGRVPPAAARHEVVRLDLRRPGRGRAGTSPGDPPTLRLGGALPRGVAGGARGRSGRSREGGARDL